MDTLRAEFFKELECPVCMELMMPPITMCESGHNICTCCRPNLDKCPICREPFMNVRNKALENLAQKVQYPCYYRTEGCSLVLQPRFIDEHQLICPYRPYNCPLSEAENIMCEWFGAFLDLKEHIETKHRNRLTETESVKQVHIQRYKGEKKYSRVIFACGEMFYQQFEVIDNVFYFIIQHIGPENYDTKFHYNFTLATSGNTESVSVTFVARSCKVDIESLHRSGQCVKLCFETVKNFLDERNNFKFEFRIKKI
jgi:E3 ubiquitin-protein ligase SIAH1